MSDLGGVWSRGCLVRGVPGPVGVVPGPGGLVPGGCAWSRGPSPVGCGIPAFTEADPPCGQNDRQV